MNNKITIFTKPLSWLQKIKFDFKNIIKLFLWLKTYWPKYVIKNLIEWFNELWLKYNVNPKNKSDIGDICLIPNWVETLRYAIWLKKKWIIKKLIAWPNISVPLNKNDIFFDKNIDIILVPSDWVKNYFLSLKNNENRIKIRATWNKDYWIWIKSENKIILYKKTCPEYLYNFIKNILKKNNIKYVEIIYWNYEQKNYLNLLNESIWMIYLQESESQWFSLQEAWTMWIPTLVWNRWFWEYKNIKHFDKKISAPYLDSRSWLFFKSEIDFENSLNIFLENITNYKPRENYLENFTNKITVTNLLEIIK